MPTLKRIRGYRFHFWSKENNEPAHIHVWKQGTECKIWLDDDLTVEYSYFPPHELTKIKKMVDENRAEFRKKWNEHFKNQNT